MVHVVCMVRCMGDNNSFRWPDREDLLDYPMDDILCTIDPPEPCGQFYRGSPMLSFSRDVLKKVEVELSKKS